MAANERKIRRCAIYTRKSSEHGLEQDFNSLDAQREAAEAYIKSQAHEGWRLVKARYDDGGISGGTLDRPALQFLLSDIRAGKIDVVVAYKVDRLTRSLADFAKLVELFEAHAVSFVAVTQQFNTTTSMGRLTLNVLLSFAQFERELASERIRDKFAASRRKGMWMGGTVPLGYDVKARKLVVNAEEAERVRLIFRQYLALGCVSALQEDLERRGVRSKQRVLGSGEVLGGSAFQRGALYHLLRNRVYLGEVVHHGVAYPGEHEAIMDEELWRAVQIKLEEHRGMQRRARAESGALLSGLMFDDRGNRMSPTYSVHRGVRYPYYVSPALLGTGKENTSSQRRVNAQAIERVVVETLSAQLSRPELMSEAGSASWSAETRSAVLDNIGRVVVGQNELQIIRKIASPRSPELGEEDAEANTHTLPLPTARPRARKEIIIPGGRDGPTRRANHALVVAIARARTWMRDLRTGKYADTGAIARRFQLNEAHVRRLLRFAYLAPDVIGAIVEGRQPPSLTVRQLLQGIPCSWPDQRIAFGFIP
jgi:site-specific DNA recombinase